MDLENMKCRFYQLKTKLENRQIIFFEAESYFRMQIVKIVLNMMTDKLPGKIALPTKFVICYPIVKKKNL